MNILENRLENIEEENKKEKQKIICKICNLFQREVILLPCMHLLYCSNCVPFGTKYCPCCDSFISGMMLCKLD